MPLSITPLGQTEVNNNTSGAYTMSVSSGSITPPAGCLLVATVVSENRTLVDNGVTTASFISFSDTIGGTGGGAWTQRGTCVRSPNWLPGQYGVNVEIWTRLVGTSPGTGTVTATNTHVSDTTTTTCDRLEMLLDLAQVTGQAASPIGGSTGNTERQVPPNSGTYALDLGSAPAVDSAVFTILYDSWDVNVPNSPPTGYTTLYLKDPMPNGSSNHTAYKNGSASQTFSWTGLNTADGHHGIALEIKAAPPSWSVVARSPVTRMQYSGGGSTVTLPLPTGTLAGDLAVVLFGCRDQSYTPWTKPTGFTERYVDDTGGNNGAIRVLTRDTAITSAEVTAGQITFAATHGFRQVTWNLATFLNGNIVNPMDAAPVGFVGSGIDLVKTLPAITTTTVGAYRLSFAVDRQSSASWGTAAGLTTLLATSDAVPLNSFTAGVAVPTVGVSPATTTTMAATGSFTTTVTIAIRALAPPVLLAAGDGATRTGTQTNSVQATLTPLPGHTMFAFTESAPSGTTPTLTTTPIVDSLGGTWTQVVLSSPAHTFGNAAWGHRYGLYRRSTPTEGTPITVTYTPFVSQVGYSEVTLVTSPGVVDVVQSKAFANAVTGTSVTLTLDAAPSAANTTIASPGLNSDQSPAARQADVAGWTTIHSNISQSYVSQAVYAQQGNTSASFTQASLGGGGTGGSTGGVIAELVLTTQGGGTSTLPTSVKAVSFPAGAAARYDRASFGMGTGTDVTWCCWAKLRVDTDYYQFAMSVDNGGSTYVHLGTQGNGSTFWIDTHSGGAGAGLDQTPGTWYFLAMVWKAAAVDTVYAVASGASTVGAGNTSTWVGLSNTDTFWIGSDGFGSEWQGSLGNVKIWTAALTQAELDAEMYKVAPQRTANLFAHYSFVRGPQTNDESGNGRALTQLGATLTVDNSGPPLVIPATYTENTSFSITATVTETDVKSLAVQEGFRWRKDNGSETTATGAASQDVNVLTPLTTNLRLRTVVDTTLDKASVAYTLNYKKSTDSLYIPVTVGSATVAPTWQANGTYNLTAAAITPAFPAGIQVGDILVLFVETANQATTIANQGGGTWTEIGTQVGVGTAGSTSAARLSMWWSRYDGVQTAPTTNSAGDHQGAFIASFRGCKRTGSPINVVPTFTTEAGPNTITIPGATTTVANCLIVTAIADDYDNVSAARYSAWTNASLASITERQDIGSTTANGGGFGMATGVKVAAGAYSATTVTAATAILANSNGSFALAPEDRPIYVSTSANITAGGEVTTARLAPPAGKSGSAYIGTIGYSNIGSGAVTTEDWYGLDAHHPARSELTYTAAAGDSITELFVYGSSATSAAVEVAVYATTGGTTITTRVGLPVSISLTTTAGWRKATCSIPLTAGVTYTLAYDWYVTAPVTMYRTTGLYSSGTSRSNSSDAALGTTWTQAGTSSGESFSVYGTVSRSPVVSFTAGRVWDDENGIDPIDIAANGYTELEWCLQAQSPAVSTDIYTFRVYAGTAPFDTYLVTPQWTIGTAVGYYDETGLSVSIGSTVTCTDTYSGVGPTILFTESFTGSDASNWDFLKWPHQHPFGTIVSGEGLIPTGGSPAQIYASQFVSDFELTFKYRWASSITGNFPEIAYRIIDGMGNPNGDGYALQINGSSGDARVYRVGAYNSLPGGGAVDATLNAAGNRWFKVRVVGHNHKVKWWDVGSGEPSTWQIDVTDTTPSVDPGGNVVVAGGFGVRWWGSVQGYVDDFTVTDLASPPTFKPNGSLRTLPHGKVIDNPAEVFTTDTDLTYCCWFKLDRTYGTGSGVMALWDGTANSYFMTTVDSSRRLVQNLKASGTVADIDSGYDVPVDTWVFLAASRSMSGGTDLYYAPQGTTTLTKIHSSAVGGVAHLPLFLVSLPSGAGYTSGCAFKVWTAALTQAQLEAEMPYYSAQRATNLLASWPMRDGMDHRAENAPADTTKWLTWLAGGILSGPKPTFLDLPSGGAHYVETGLSCPIVANLLSTDKAGRKEPGLSIPITATATCADSRHSREGAPAPAALTYIESSTFFDANTPKTVAATWSAGETVIVWSGAGGANDILTAPTVAGLTFTLQTEQDNAATTEPESHIWTAVAGSSGSGNISISMSGATIHWGFSVWRFPAGSSLGVKGSDLNEAVLSLAVGAGSAVVGGVADWNATVGTSAPATGSGTATERMDGQSGHWRYWTGDWVGVSAGSFGFGIASYAGLKTAQSFIEVVGVSVGLQAAVTATVTCTDSAHFKEIGSAATVVATVDITADYHAGAGANHYDETGRSVTVVVTVTATDQADWKEVAAPTAATDDFNRANGVLGANWADAAAAGRRVLISSNVGVSETTTASAVNRSVWATPMASNNLQFAECDVFANGSAFVGGPVICANTLAGGGSQLNDGYSIRWTVGTGLLQLRRRDVQVGTTPTVALTGTDRVRLESEQIGANFTVRVLVNGVLRITYVDATPETNLYVGVSTNGPSQVDNWAGGVSGGAAIVATVISTDRVGNKELALSLPIVADAATTTLAHRRELAVSLPIIAAVDSTSQAHFREPVASTTITATVTLTDLRKYVDLALSVPVTVTTQSTAQGHFREVTIVYVQVPVTCTDLQQSPGHFDETGRVVLAMATATSTDRAKFREDTPLSVEASVTVTLTDGRHYIEVSLTVPITAAVEATSLIHLLEPVSLLITAAVSVTDRAHFREVLPTSVLATFTVSDHIALPGEHRTVSIVATVTMTERSSYRQLALSVPVQATVLRVDSLSALAFFPLLIAATFKASDQKSRVGVVVLNDADALYLGNERVDAVYVGSSQAWP